MGILCWPFMLSHPLSNVMVIFRAMKEFPLSLGQIFEGRLIWSDQIPWYYLSKYILITVPIIVIIGFASFIILSKKIIKKTNWLEIALVFFSCFFIIILSSFSTNNDYGGWRHLLFIYPSMVICSVIGLGALLELVKNKLLYYLIFLVFIVLSLKPIIHIVRNHPLEYVYYNEIMGGVNKAYTNYEMDYFQNSPRIASEWLLKHIKEKGINAKGKVVIASNCSDNYYFRNDTAKIITFYCKYIYKTYYDWDYMIVCNTYIDPFLLKNKYFPPTNTIYQVKVDDVPVCVVIERKQKFDCQANKFFQSNDVTMAIEQYKKALSIEPNNIDVLVSLMRCYFLKRDNDGVQKIIDYILTIYPNNPDALNFEGLIYKHTGRLDKAIEMFNFIIANINPSYSQAYYNLGNCYLIQNDYNSALTCFEKSIELNRDYKEAYISIANILHLQHRDEEAKEYIIKANLR